MNRRIALKNVALTFGTMLSAPAWAKAWTAGSLPAIANEGTYDVELLNTLVEVLIPKTDTPGAGEMGVDKFVMVMVNDCTPEDQRTIFMKQLGSVNDFAKEKYTKEFAGLNDGEKAGILALMSVSESLEWKTFFGLLKRYTVQGYQTSEYVMTKNGFQFAPGFFNGCVELNPTE